MENKRIEYLVRATSNIDGKQHPECVPFNVRMRLFFYRFKVNDGGYHVELKNELSDQDLAVLSSYSEKHVEAVKNDDAEYSTAADRIIANSVGLSAIQIAEALEQAMAHRERVAVERYEAVLQSLSTAGQAAVRRYAFERVRPHMSLQMPTAMANASPELFMEDVEERRRVLEQGSGPPS